MYIYIYIINTSGYLNFQNLNVWDRICPGSDGVLQEALRGVHDLWAFALCVFGTWANNAKRSRPVLGRYPAASEVHVQPMINGLFKSWFGYIVFCLPVLGSKKWGPQGSTTTTSAATTSAASTISWVSIGCKLRQHPGRSLFGIGGGCRALGPRRGVGTNGFARLIGGGFRGWFNRLPFILKQGRKT